MSAHAHSHSHELRSPGVLQVGSGLKTFFLVSAVVGIAAFLLGLKTDAHRAWSAYLLGHFFFLCLGLGGLFFAGLQWLTGAMWSAPIRRVAEGFSAYLPFCLVSFGILLLGGHDLYHWTHAEAVQNDAVLAGKAGYLNSTFFAIRNFVAILIWIFFARKLIGNSIAQDQSGDQKLTKVNQTWSPLFTILFAVTFTMVSFDQIMSLNPHWFSTIFGIYCFAGLFGSTLALLTLIVLRLHQSGELKDFVNDNHFHDLGKLLFAFTVFWAYIGFSQFMLIWYANLPEETVYYLARKQGNWSAFMPLLFVVRFVVPFFVLMTRNNKRNPKILRFVAVWMLLAQIMDLVWMIQPETLGSHGPAFGWIEVGAFLAFLGIFGTMVSRFYQRHSIVAIRDPRLHESVFHHHQ